MDVFIRLFCESRNEFHDAPLATFYLDFGGMPLPAAGIQLFIGEVECFVKSLVIKFELKPRAQEAGPFYEIVAFVAGSWSATPIYDRFKSNLSSCGAVSSLIFPAG